MMCTYDNNEQNQFYEKVNACLIYLNTRKTTERMVKDERKRKRKRNK